MQEEPPSDECLHPHSLCGKRANQDSDSNSLLQENPRADHGHQPSRPRRCFFLFFSVKRRRSGVNRRVGWCGYVCACVCLLVFCMMNFCMCQMCSGIRDGCGYFVCFGNMCLPFFVLFCSLPLLLSPLVLRAMLVCSIPCGCMVLIQVLGRHEMAAEAADWLGSVIGAANRSAPAPLRRIFHSFLPLNVVMLKGSVTERPTGSLELGQRKPTTSSPPTLICYS